MRTPTTTVNKLTRVYGTSDPFKLARHLGIQIVFEQLGNRLGYYSHLDIPTIHINEEASDKQQTFTCAHELGHAVLHTGVNTSFLKRHTFFWSDKLESEANFFALILLLSRGMSMTLHEVVHEYGVPRQIALKTVG